MALPQPKVSNFTSWMTLSLIFRYIFMMSPHLALPTWPTAVGVGELAHIAGMHEMVHHDITVTRAIAKRSFLTSQHECFLTAVPTVLPYRETWSRRYSTTAGNRPAGCGPPPPGCFHSHRRQPAGTRGPPRGAGRWPAAHGWDPETRRCTPSRRTHRCPPRPEAAAGTRPQCPRSRSSHCRAAGAPGRR